VASQMTQVNQISEMIEPLIAKAEAAEEAGRELAEQALAKAYKSAQARMTTLGLTLPLVPEPGLQNYLTAQLAQLNTKQLVKSDLNTAELLERNELFQGLNLYIDGADVAHGTIATLLPSRNPFKHPRGVSFKMEDKEVETTMQHALKKKLETTLGLSVSGSSSTSGGVVGPIGGAAWSAKMSAALSTNMQGDMTSGSSSVETTNIKTCRATFNATQYALADADYELSAEFERALVDVKEGGQTCAQVISEFGSHLTMSAVLGGQYVIEASVRTKTFEKDSTERTAVGQALTMRTSGAAYAAGFIGSGAGAGSVSAAAATDANNTEAKGIEEQLANHLSQSCLSTYVTGGSPGSLNVWLSAMQQSNNVWEVIDRDVNHLRPVWELVRKSRLLDDKEQGTVALKLFEAWEFNNDEKELAEKKKLQVQDGMSHLDKIKDERPEQEKITCLIAKVGKTFEVAQNEDKLDWSNCGLDDTDIEVLEYVMVTNTSLIHLDLRSGETSKEKKLKLLKSKEREAFDVPYSQGIVINVLGQYDHPAHIQWKQAKKELEEYSTNFVSPERNAFKMESKRKLDSIAKKIRETRPKQKLVVSFPKP